MKERQKHWQTRVDELGKMIGNLGAEEQLRWKNRFSIRPHPTPDRVGVRRVENGIPHRLDVRK